MSEGVKTKGLNTGRGRGKGSPGKKESRMFVEERRLERFNKEVGIYDLSREDFTDEEYEEAVAQMKWEDSNPTMGLLDGFFSSENMMRKMSDKMLKNGRTL